eukprot:2330789-Amphidinium_carterae.1
METFNTFCKDPSTYANYPTCKPGLLSVEHINQQVKMGNNPDHSRPMERSEVMELRTVLFLMIDPSSYAEIEPADKRMAAKARECHSHLYPLVKHIVHEDIKKKR